MKQIRVSHDSIKVIRTESYERYGRYMGQRSQIDQTSSMPVMWKLTDEWNIFMDVEEDDERL